jgi:hypothetical protein
MKRVSLLMAIVLVLGGCSKKTETNYYGQDKSQTNNLSKTASNGEADLTTSEAYNGENFLIQKGTEPKKESVNYFNIDEKINPSTNKKTVFITGIKIIAADNSETPIQISENLEKVVISADELIISKTLSFPGADVTINAKKLIFTNDGKISTKPNNLLTIPKETKNGQKGLSAGNITLNVESIDLGDKKIRFDLSGGKGQAAGFGIPGRAGKSVAPLEGDNIIAKCEHIKTYCRDSEAVEMESPNEGLNCSPLELPTNGEIGTKAGAPGAGGNGGTLSIASSIKIEKDFINLSGGEIGDIAAVTKGGIAGTPNTFVRKHIFTRKFTGLCSHQGSGGRLGVRSFQNALPEFETLGVTKDGQNISSATSPIESTKIGLISSKSEFNNTVSSKVLLYKLQYAKDLYRNNYFEKAKVELTDLINSNIDKNETLTLITLNEANQLLNQLSSHKDLDGSPINSVPEISFSKITTAYKNQIESAFKTLEFTTYFSNKILSAEEKSKKILNQKSELEKGVIDLYTQNQQAHEDLSDVTRLSSEVLSKENAFEVAIQKVEKEIENEANQNLEARASKKKLLGALHLVANLAKVFPAGQPAIGAIGTSLDTVVSMSEKEDSNWKDNLKTGFDIYKDLGEKLKSSEWKKSEADWNSNYRNLFYSQFKANHSDDKDQVGDYLKNAVSKTTPLYSNISAYYKNIYSKQVPKSEYEAEVERIKSINPRFKELTAMLNELQSKKAELDQKINRSMATISRTESEIYKNFMAIESSDSEYISATDGMDFTLNDTVKFYEASAKSRLIEFKKLLIQSYNYRLLIPYKGSFDLEQIENNLKKFSSSNGETIQTDLIKNLYYADLNEIAGGLFDSLNTGSLKEYEAEISYELNSGELDALANGKTIYISPKAKKLLVDQEENARIISINVDSVNANIESNKKGFDIAISSTPNMNIERDGKTYRFYKSGNPTLWKTRFDNSSGELSESQMSSNMNSIFNVLYSNNDSVEKSELYERVGLDTSLAINLFGEVKSISYMKIKIKYSYSNK